MTTKKQRKSSYRRKQGTPGILVQVEIPERVHAYLRLRAAASGVSFSVYAGGLLGWGVGKYLHEKNSIRGCLNELDLRLENIGKKP